MSKTQDKQPDKKKVKKQNYFKKQQKKINSKKDDVIEKPDENDFFRLNEAEKEHLQYLDKTYRDRAKERRETETNDFNEEDTEYEKNNTNIFDDGSSKNTIKKGLDFELFQKEKEKEEEVAKENSSKIKKEETKENLIKKLPKTLLGMSMQNVLLKNNEDLKRKKIPIEDIHYEYDLDNIFGNDMPKVIIRKSKKSKENFQMICPGINENVLNQMKKVMAYVKNKSSRKFNEKNEESKNSGIQKNAANPIKNNANLLSIADEINDDDDIFLDIKKEKIKADETKQPETFKKIFDDLKKTFQDKNLKENELEKLKRLEKSSMLADVDFSIPEPILGNKPLNKRPRDDEDSGYGECFPEVELPSLEELKIYREKHGISIKEAALKSFADKKQYELKKGKNKKKQLEKDAVKIQEMLQDNSNS